MFETSRKLDQRYTCHFVPRRIGAMMRASTFVTRNAHAALGAFVHLDVPEREPGWITISDERGELVLSALWPPDSAPRA